MSELTPQQNRALGFLDELSDLKKKNARMFVRLGFLLYTIREEKLYQYMGEAGLSGFDSFLSSPEIGYAPSTCYAFIGIYEYYILRLKLTEEEIIKNPVNRLINLMAPLKKLDDGEAKKVIEQVGPMNHKDYVDEVRERKFKEERPYVKVYKDQSVYKYQLVIPAGLELSDFCAYDETSHDVLELAFT